MSRSKHSYIQFYMDDWQGGTSGMTRMIKSVYFDICLYNWDKCKPMTPAHYTLITQDLQDMGQPIIEMLIETGKVEHDPARGYYSPRALSEGQKAFETWSAKSAGGKKGGRGRTAEEPKTKVIASTVESSASSTPETMSEAMLEDTRHNQNQNQNQNHLAATAAKGGGGGEIEDEVEEDAAALARIHEASQKAEALKLGVHQIVDTWNIMARTTGLPVIARVDEKRFGAARALVGQFGADEISKAIQTIPASPFLTGNGENGFVAKFDWLMKPDNFNSLIEGNYHGKREPVEEKTAPPVKAKRPIDLADKGDAEDIAKFRERLKTFAGDSVYADKFGDSVAVVLVDNDLLDLVFTSSAEMTMAQIGFEGLLITAAKSIGRTLRLQYRKFRGKPEEKKHIDTEQNGAVKEDEEGKPVGE